MYNIGSPLPNQQRDIIIIIIIIIVKKQWNKRRNEHPGTTKDYHEDRSSYGLSDKYQAICDRVIILSFNFTYGHYKPANIESSLLIVASAMEQNIGYFVMPHPSRIANYILFLFSFLLFFLFTFLFLFYKT